MHVFFFLIEKYIEFILPYRKVYRIFLTIPKIKCNKCIQLAKYLGTQWRNVSMFLFVAKRNKMDLKKKGEKCIRINYGNCLKKI